MADYVNIRCSPFLFLLRFILRTFVKKKQKNLSFPLDDSMFSEARDS